ncbi:MAG TPA: ABC transporter substrate-binding protein [Gammaproteobacteria bacterium]
MKIIKELVLIISFIFLPLASGLHAGENQAAVSVVDSLHQALIKAMQTPESFSERYAQLSPVIENTFDTPVIARVILSRYWNDLDETQQSAFIERFDDLSISNYASKFDDFGGEKFRLLGQQELKKGRLVIKTELVKPDGEAVRFDYILHEREGKWLIISVIADGVNDLSLKRSEYGTIMENDGFDVLLAEIDKKIQALKASE